MKFYQRGLNLFLFIVFLGIPIAPVYAQFSILPRADEKADCKALLNLYEINRKIPTVTAVKSETKRTSDLEQFEIADKSIKADEAYEKAQSESAGCYCDASTPSKTAGCSKKCDDLAKSKTNKEKADTELKKVTDKSLEDSAAAEKAAKNKTPERDNLLGCAIKTGRISFAMIPYFITYIINFLLALSGLVSVLFIVIGGFQYVYGGLSEHKDKAKKTIQHALMGMAVSILAWSIVNVIIGAITG